jgi:hypothetical protein
MTLPHFTADRALYGGARSYRGHRAAAVPRAGVLTMQDYWCADCWCPDNSACYVKSWPDGTQTCRCIFQGGGHVADAETLLRA